MAAYRDLHARGLLAGMLTAKWLSGTDPAECGAWDGPRAGKRRARPTIAAPAERAA